MHGYVTHGRTSTSQHHRQTSTESFFKNPLNSQPISPGHDVIYTPAHLLSGVYYDNGDCHILCARASTAPIDYTPELFKAQPN